MGIEQGRDLYRKTQCKDAGKPSESEATPNDAVQKGRDLYLATKGK